MIPFSQNWPGWQRDQRHWVVPHVEEEVYWSTLTFRWRVAKYKVPKKDLVDSEIKNQGNMVVGV